MSRFFIWACPDRKTSLKKVVLLIGVGLSAISFAPLHYTKGCRCYPSRERLVVIRTSTFNIPCSTFLVQHSSFFNLKQKNLFDLNRFFFTSSRDKVVFTLQNKGSYNKAIELVEKFLVVFTLQNKVSYNIKQYYITEFVLFLPFKIKVVTTKPPTLVDVLKLCLPFKIKAVTTN